MLVSDWISFIVRNNATSHNLEQGRKRGCIQIQLYSYSNIVVRMAYEDSYTDYFPYVHAGYLRLMSICHHTIKQICHFMLFI